MTTRKQKPAPYQVGYGKPPLHTRFQKGKSGNPSGRPRRAATERAKALALKEAYRAVTVREGERVAALPAIQAVLRSQRRGSRTPWSSGSQSRQERDRKPGWC